MASTSSCTVRLKDDPEALSKGAQLMFLETWSALKRVHVPWHMSPEFSFCVILGGFALTKPLHLLPLLPFQFLSGQDSTRERLRKRTERQAGLMYIGAAQWLQHRPAGSITVRLLKMQTPKNFTANTWRGNAAQLVCCSWWTTAVGAVEGKCSCWSPSGQSKQCGRLQKSSYCEGMMDTFGRRNKADL